MIIHGTWLQSCELEFGQFLNQFKSELSIITLLFLNLSLINFPLFRFRCFDKWIQAKLNEVVAWNTGFPELLYRWKFISDGISLLIHYSLKIPCHLLVSKSFSSLLSLWIILISSGLTFAAVFGISKSLLVALESTKSCSFHCHCLWQLVHRKIIILVIISNVQTEVRLSWEYCPKMEVSANNLSECADFNVSIIAGRKCVFSGRELTNYGSLLRLSSWRNAHDEYRHLCFFVF